MTATLPATYDNWKTKLPTYQEFTAEGQAQLTLNYTIEAEAQCYGNDPVEWDEYKEVVTDELAELIRDINFTLSKAGIGASVEFEQDFGFDVRLGSRG